MLDAWHQQTEWEADVAYASGAAAERDRIATGLAEVDAAWRARGAMLHRDRVTERLALFERCAAANPAATWRGRYPGGAVDFDTGRLVRRLKAAA